MPYNQPGGGGMKGGAHPGATPSFQPGYNNPAHPNMSAGQMTAAQTQLANPNRNGLNPSQMISQSLQSHPVQQYPNGMKGGNRPPRSKGR
jgi:hypothetical protein